jgi:arginine/lysine/ornithine decarboxylase
MIAKKKPVDKPVSNTIQNCTFVGVQYDAKAVEAIRTVAEGLVENAKALGKLAEVLKASNVTVEAMLRIGA